MDDSIKMIAARIADLREVFSYGAEEVAAKLQIPAKQYEGYENSGEDIPISVLYSLCNLYGVDMTDLISGKSPKLSTISVVRRGEGLAVDRYEGYHYENIAYKFMHRKMEPMIVTLLPETERPKQVTHSGQEINYCLSGEVVLSYDGGETVLRPGDCAYFDPTRPHGQHAVNGEASFLTVIQE